MSHSIEFMKFLDGEASDFSLEKLNEILLTHRCTIIDGEDFSLVDFPLAGGNTTVGHEQGLIGKRGNNAISFGIGRPAYDEAMKNLSFELLSIFGLCAFPSYGEVVFATSNIENHIPPGLLESCAGGLKVVSAPNQLW